MTIEEINFETSINDRETLTLRDPIFCPIQKEERKHLFHTAGFVNRIFRDRLIFPLMSRTDSFSRKILEREDWFSSDLFWNSEFIDLRYPRHHEVRSMFNRYDQEIVINEDGKEIKVKCRILETKGCPRGADEKVLNHLIVQGNVSTLNNNMPGVYPFLSSYLKNKELNPQLPHARFIVLTHYGHTIKDSRKDTGLISKILKKWIYVEEPLKETNYLPGDMEEWGFVFKKSLETLVNEYGSLDLLAAHSLGNIPVVAHLNHVKDEEFIKLFPKTLFLSQGPSSSYEISKNIPFQWYPWGWCLGFGGAIYGFMKLVGWTLSLDQVLTNRLNKIAAKAEFSEKLKETNIVITEVDKDYYFPDKASLAASDVLEDFNEKINLYRLTFNPPLSWGCKRGQHNYNLGLLQRQDLMKEKLHINGNKTIHLENPKQIVEYEKDHPLFIKHGESIVDAVLRPIFERAVENCQACSLEGRVIPIELGA